MAKPSLDRLLAAEAWLNRSFAACVLTVLMSLGWTFFVVRAKGMAPREAGFVALGILLAQVTCYAWYAGAAGAAAMALEDRAWKYVVWILVAPFLTLVPIPIVSTLIGVSPLSIKFLLGGQLQTAIRESTFAD